MKFATPFTELFRVLTPAEDRELRSSIESKGVIHPVIVYQSKKHGSAIIDGLNRARIAEELGVEFPVDDRGELSDDEAKVLAEELNHCRRHLSPSDWRQMAADRAERIERVVARRSQGASMRTIAEEEGVSHPQVIRDLNSSTGTGVPVGPEKVKGKDGKTRTAKPKRKPKAEPAEPTDEETPEPSKPLDPCRGGNNFDFGANAPKDAEPGHDVEPVAETPAERAAAFNKELESTCREIDKLKARIEEWKPNPLCYSTHWQSHVAQLESVRKSIWQGRPVHECPYCDGIGVENGEPCKPCKGTGYLKRHSYDSACAALGIEVGK